jgi:hypothetical protein
MAVLGDGILLYVTALLCKVAGDTTADPPFPRVFGTESPTEPRCPFGSAVLLDVPAAPR